MFFRRALPLLFVVALSAELIHNFPAGDPLRAVFWKDVPTPGGTTLLRRTPKETRGQLAARLDLRAMEEERDFDFTAAEADWKTRPPIELADFYHRRNRPMEEYQALLRAAAAPASAATPSAPAAMPSALAADKLLPPSQQSSWRVFQRIFKLIDDAALPKTLAASAYQAWIARYPAEPDPAQRYFAFLIGQKQYAAASAQLERYAKTFPADRVFPVSARAQLAEARGNAASALAVYDKEFDPLWPQPLQQAYFKLLTDRRALRDFLSRNRAAAEAAPEDFAPAGRIYFYYQQSGNAAAARRTLLEYQLRHKSPWRDADLRLLAKLFEAQRDFPNAAAVWKQVWDAGAAEDGMAGLIADLLAAPDQPIAFGTGDLTFLRDVGTMDPYPGFFNGLLSLLFNRSDPGMQLEHLQRQNAPSYFHRAAAAELLDRYEKQFPRAARRAELRAALIDAYATYGADAGVIAAGVKYLADFPADSSAASAATAQGAAPAATRRIDVAMRMAESYARTSREREEFALYDTLLKALSAKASGVPLGAAAIAPPPSATNDDEDSAAGALQGAFQTRRFDPNGRSQPNGQGAPNTGMARSPEYARVLDRYVARLVSLRRVTEATALYRREIDRNPDDPGLYERLAAFLDQNRRTTEIEAVYRRAMARFPGQSWQDKLARWFLRQKRQGDFDKLTREVIAVFSGSELENYFRAIVAGNQIDPVMYRQLNLAAHERFPDNLTFVHNLIAAYGRKETADSAALARLVHEYWMQDEGLRDQYLESLAQSGRLDAEIQAAAAMPANAATMLFTAEAQAWESHFEAAIAPYDKVVADYPAETALVARDAMLHRSLGQPDRAVAMEQTIARFDPRDHAALTRAGEIQADRERYDLAAPYWNKIPSIDPGRADGYLEAATIFWDYYRYDDAQRLIHEARAKLRQPELDAFEMGAIYENRRDYPRAIAEYVRGAVAADSPARRRLVRLDKRKDLHDTVEAAVAKSNSFELHIAVLGDDARRADLEKYLSALVPATASFELLSKIEQEAATRGMDDIRERAMLREIAINKDPVEDMRLRLALARFDESVNHIDAARTVMSALYRDHPTILGVVRATVDFEWRNKSQASAVDTLVKAAAASYPAQKSTFLFEAARKATDAKEFARARELLTALLQEKPFSAEYLAAMADTYSAAGDDRGLRDFYTATLAGLRTAPITPEDRMSRTAAMRRGLIPALVRLKDPAGALDQYIEILNRFPEDESLAKEAATFASRNHLKPRLVDYYTKTASASPRDFRWPLVLGRLETQLEDFPAAITNYTAALAIRPDRTDLLEAREGLEERLLRFPDELADDQRLYELRYHDPRWMEKSAEVLARLGRTNEAIAALQKALIEGRPERAENQWAVARKLESWNMVEQALPFAEKGGDGDDIYFTVLLRLRRYDQAIAHFKDRVPNSAGVIAREYTPAEKSAFAASLAASLPKAPPELRMNLLGFMQQAGLLDLQARWLNELAVAGAGKNDARMYAQQLQQLQTRRMKFDDLAKFLEAYAAAVPVEQRTQIESEAADNYRKAGNTNEEFRVLDAELRRNTFVGPELTRYLELLRARDPQRLIQLARGGSGTELRNAAAAQAIAGDDAQFALRAVAARGAAISPVWTKAYTAVTGLYFADPAPEVSTAFTGALDFGTIGQRLARQPDRNQQLVGDIWFYYGSRYGEYLDAMKRAGAEDYLPAMLEGHPSSASAFLALADSYAAKKNVTAALADYEHAIELQPTLAAAYSRAADLLFAAGRREEALAHWRAALAHQPAAPEMAAILAGAKRNGVFAELQPDLERELRLFFHSNAAFRSIDLMEAAVNAGGVPWMLELTTSAPDPLQVLAPLVNADWLSSAGREQVYQRMIAITARRVADAHGVARTEALYNERQQRTGWINYLLDTKQSARAQTEFAALEREIAANRNNDPNAPVAPYGDERGMLPGDENDLSLLELRIAAHVGPSAMDALFERYRRPDANAPSSEVLRTLAAKIGDDVSLSAAQKILEFAYQRDIDGDNPPPAAFLGLAEVDLQRGDVTAAMALLHRLNLIADPAFEYLMPSAELLEKYSHPMEAREFLATRARAVPWDADARRTAPVADPVAVALRIADPAARLRALLAIVADAPEGTNSLAAGAGFGNFGAGNRAWRVFVAPSNVSSNSPLRVAIVHAAYQVGRYSLAVNAGVNVDQGRAQGGANGEQNRALAADLARSYEQLDELGMAANNYRIAALKQDEERIRRLLQIRQDNAQRAPVIRVALEQEHTVLPRRTQ